MRDKTGMVVAVTLILVTSAFAATAAAKGNHMPSVTFTIIHKFNYTDGSAPTGRVIVDQQGNVFGTTNGGGLSTCTGKNGCGTVYELVNSGGTYTEKMLHRFTGANGDGCGPDGTLLMDKNGSLFGVTVGCGAGYGTIFKLVNRNGRYVESVLHKFSSSEGNSPTGPIVMDKSGNLYGTTVFGGGCQTCGTVWELSAGKLTTLVNMDLNTTGIEPFGGLTMDPSGNLWGANSEGGLPGQFDGVIYELTKSGGTWNFNLIHSFSGPEGAYPWYETPIFDKTGRVFATTTFGGKYGPGGYGVVLQLKHSSGTWKSVTLHNFTGSNGDGIACYGGLSFTSDGNLVGATESGGSRSDGMVFELIHTSTGWREKVLHTFSGTQGPGPFWGVSTDAAGNIYGVNGSGSGNGNGLVFKISGVQ
jgi:uncharacterized repeat protein (TIGR03803 family)